MRSLICMAGLAAVALLAAGCAVSKKHVVPPAQVRPALEATREQLLARYNEQARAVRSLNATVDMKPTTGSAYSGVIEEYHGVNGFILAERPARIRVIGQAPVVAKNIFDMVSDGETFRIFIPSKHKFLVGSTDFERPAKKPIENLRPQHLLDALFWTEIAASAPVLFEEWTGPEERAYVLTVLRSALNVPATSAEAQGAPAAPGEWEIARKIWFDRAYLDVSRLEIFAPGGRMVSDIHYADWQAVETSPAARYPRQIRIARPHDDYQLEMLISKLAINETMAAERFHLEQPPGTELVRVGEDAKD